jgi:Papain fold toxin 2
VGWMSDLSDEEVYRSVGEIVRQYGLLKCDDCARDVLKWLRQNQVEGTLLRLKTRYRERYILSLRLERLGIGESITSNGIHYGVEVRGRVFDNLSSKGLTREEWIQDFSSRNDQFLVEELEDF